MSVLLDLSDHGGSPASAVREGAGFWIRALARGIDTLVHLAVGLGVGLATGILVVIGSAFQGVEPDAAIDRLSTSPPLGYLAAWVGGLAMHVVSEGLHGSTLGKRLCGLTVISDDGRPATLLGAFKRNIAYLWDALFFGWVAAQKMSESVRRQRVGDVWGHTQVVRLSSIEAGARRSGACFLLVTVAGVTLDGAIVFIELASRLA